MFFKLYISSKNTFYYRKFLSDSLKNAPGFLFASAGFPSIKFLFLSGIFVLKKILLSFPQELFYVLLQKILLKDPPESLRVFYKNSSSTFFCNFCRNFSCDSFKNSSKSFTRNFSREFSKILFFLGISEGITSSFEGRSVSLEIPSRIFSGML